jgi:hypothetical protein
MCVHARRFSDGDGARHGVITHKMSRQTKMKEELERFKLMSLGERMRAGTQAIHGLREPFGGLLRWCGFVGVLYIGTESKAEYWCRGTL